MIGMVESLRELNGSVIQVTPFYIGSIGADAETFARTLHRHWMVENPQHWSLYVAFREDDSQVQEPVARKILPCCARWR
jgi:predicted transposase YbfD/YdcC